MRFAVPRVWKLPDLWTHRTRPQVFAKPQTVLHSSHTRYSLFSLHRRQQDNSLKITHRFCGGGVYSSAIRIHGHRRRLSRMQADSN